MPKLVNVDNWYNEYHAAVVRPNTVVLHEDDFVCVKFYGTDLCRYNKNTYTTELFYNDDCNTHTTTIRYRELGFDVCSRKGVKGVILKGEFKPLNYGWQEVPMS